MSVFISAMSCWSDDIRLLEEGFFFSSVVFFGLGDDEDSNPIDMRMSFKVLA